MILKCCLVDGIASVPSLRGCHTQAKSLDVLMERIKESFVKSPKMSLRAKRSNLDVD
ncbi:MAG: type II toxin-antitoxin system HicB family antitoxin [Calditrichaeota bacterium]|nr:type II toxin-antitoxin system HicB family antitoxin [Calditrichota bacterium]